MQPAQKTWQGSAQLTLNGKTYVPDEIDREKSRVKFCAPDVHESLERQREFKIRDVLRGGRSGGYFNSPIMLNFQVNEKPDDRYPTQVVFFHKGKLIASFDDGRLEVKFEGRGPHGHGIKDVAKPVTLILL